MKHAANSIWHGVKVGVVRILDFLGITLTDGQLAAVLQFIKFSFVGMSNAVICYSVNLVTLSILHYFDIFKHTDYLVGNVMAWLISVIWGFTWNRKFVFRADRAHAISWRAALIKSYLSYAFTGLVMSNVLSIVWVQLLNINRVIAPIINILLCTPVNFLLIKYWAFRQN
ncbi:MAG: GtrA family protein [Oscillospiraceae bacterium]|nr:GtrA family protein [Oscillospiraceae bacterium]